MKQRVGKELRKRPTLGLFIQVAFAVAAVVLLVTGLLLENVLFFLATSLAALGGVATRRAIHLEQERQMRSGPKVSKPSSSGPKRPAAKPDTANPPPSTGGVITCTDTGKAISECGCATRHVATSDGANRYGKPVGTPIGRKNKKTGGS